MTNIGSGDRSRRGGKGAQVGQVGQGGQAGQAGQVAQGAQGWAQDWAARGACRDSEPDALFVQGAAQQRAKLICQRCPVVVECLADALDNRTEFGVWGGRTERERRAMLKRHPHIRSWRALFESDRAMRAAGKSRDIA